MSTNEKEQVKLACGLYDVVNYALWNHGESIVRHIDIQNNTSEDLDRVTVKITSDSGLILPFEQEVQGLRVGENYRFTNLNPILNGELLASLTEKCSCNVTVQVFKKVENPDDEVTELLLASETVSVTVLAYDQWTGLGNAPELLASFVMPNHPTVTDILKNVSASLKEWTGDPSLDGYQSGSTDRVRYMVAAVYAALQSLSITYAEPPASFETAGQRVRLADAVYKDLKGTCLDLTLLFAGCIEALGLNPVLLLTKGHAMAGVWLEENSFPDCITDDPSQITKRMSKGIHEMTAVECTALCAGPKNSFEKAEKKAADTLHDLPEFFAAIDVWRARRNHYTPMPVRTKNDNGDYVIENAAAADTKDAVMPDAQMNPFDFSQIEKDKVTKQTLWERNLLDLSMRNLLINMRITKSVVPVFCDDVALLEDSLAENEEFKVLPRPDEMDFSEAKVTPEGITDLGAYKEVISLDCKHSKLHSIYTEKELSTSLTKLYRSAKTSLEENGASTLYLAMGLLRWKEDKENAVNRYAPLLLIPVEITRKASNIGFALHRRDEDTQINVTLLEFLKQTFDLPIYGLNPAPTDEHGLDIPKIFAMVRTAVMEMPGWDVVEAAIIGNFSFSQFVMWNDIHSKTEFLDHNKIVHGLMNGVVDWDCTIPEDVDTAEAYLPITVDASQLRAINMAAAGVSFVLHGPPGTGKSQTITAMISNALTKGKTVLFVAEKMAALEVVQKRLAALGIDDFCLELHSNKATKKSVLDQLKKGLELENTTDETAYESKLHDIARMRESLDAYVKALHVKRPFGKSLRELMDLYETVPELGEELRFDEDYASGLTESMLSDQMQSLERLIAAGREIGHPYGHPLSCVQRTSYSQSLKFDMEPVVSAWKESLEKLADDEEALANCAGFRFEQAACGQGNGISAAGTQSAQGNGISAAGTQSAHGNETLAAGMQSAQGNETLAAGMQPVSRNIPSTEDDLRLLYDFARCVLCAAQIPSFLMKAENPDKEFYTCFTYMEKRDAYRRERNEILTRWNENFLKMDMDSLEQRYEQANKKLFGKGKALSALTEELKNYASFAPAAEQIPAYVNEVKLFQKETAEFERTEEALPFEWREILKNHDSQEEMKNYQEQINAQLKLVKRFAARIQSLEEYGKTENCVQLAMGMLQDMDAESAARTAVDELLMLDHGAGLISQGNNAALVNVPAQTALSDTLLLHASEIKDWIVYKQFEAECIAQGLGPVCDAYKKGLTHDAVIDVYRRSVYRAIILYTIKSEPVLNEFTGTGFNARIEQFKKLDEEFMELTRTEMYHKLLHNLPHSNESVEISKELNILRRAISSNGRGMSIRALFEQIPVILPRLCPCMLMSPISVAQYLEAKNDLVDIVIFDEASQLPSCKAIGVLARGKDAVIVGDPNQMPPTTFFAGSAVDEDNLDLEDLDSILDDCLALGMPQSHLRWHYRSRHESLIAFSNQEFYENSMLTFPSVNDREKRVTLVKVEGNFDRGKGRVNVGEAQAIVEEIRRRYSDPALKDQSIGVVTFNIQQQTLVEDLLQKAFEKDLEFDSWANSGADPLFVKNLENVQGDERDVILFSVAFGPDQNGKLSLNFGPLNKDGGWKRLNVAVSRSRMEMMVFTTMTADMIDLRHSRSKGVEALRDFLEYAEKGRIMDERQDTVDTKKQGILNHICAALEEAGYHYQTHVGHSKFRVDIAVVNPYDEEEYLMGILLDGEYYRQSARTKDREVAQENVLQGLGWNLHRIWTLDWWDNREKELNKLMENVAVLDQEALEKKKQAEATEAEKAKAEAAEEAEEAEEAVAEKTKAEVAEEAEEAEETKAEVATEAEAEAEAMKEVQEATSEIAEEVAVEAEIAQESMAEATEETTAEAEIAQESMAEAAVEATAEAEIAQESMPEAEAEAMEEVQEATSEIAEEVAAEAEIAQESMAEATEETTAEAEVETTNSAKQEKTANKRLKTKK